MSRLARMLRIAAVLSLAALPLCLTATAASAAPPPVKTDADLTALWTTVLQTPNPQPFSSPPGGSYCWNLGGTVAPFGPTANGGTCTVKPGTKIFVAAHSSECSTFPGDDNPNPGETLADCAKRHDVSPAPAVTVDNKPVPVSEAVTRTMQITLPADNIFGLPAGTTGQSAGHGWISHLNPLTPGTHTIKGSGSVTFKTTIVVQPL